MIYEKEKKFLLTNIKKNYKNISNENVKPLEEKTFLQSANDYISKLEKNLISQILKSFPKDKIFVGEPNDVVDIIERTWVINLIDNLQNFSKGSSIFGMQLALIVNNEVVVSAIYLPKSDELFWAIDGEGSYINNTKILFNTSRDTVLEDKIISFSDYTKDELSINSKNKFVTKISSNIADINMYGSVAFDFCYASKFANDGCVVISKKISHIVAGVLLCKEAGLFVTNTQGKKYYFGDKGVVIARTKNLHRLMVDSYK